MLANCFIVVFDPRNAARLSRAADSLRVRPESLLSLFVLERLRELERARPMRKERENEFEISSRKG